MVAGALSVTVHSNNVQSSWNGIYTEAQAAEGAGLYRAHCASCHGESLGGAEAVPALTGVTFNATWDGVPVLDLFERLRTSMPPGKSGAVTRPGHAAILAFLLKANGMPPGDKPLGADKASLSGLVYRTHRP
jgi:mono/diheme cytochrome c family protein